MGRRPCCAKVGLNKGAWSAREDRILSNYIEVHGEGQWRDLPQRAGLKRCGKSCRLRWLNYLKPGIKRGNISKEEEELIIKLHKLLGNRWSLIAGRLPGRTDNEIKNYWNTYLSKKVQNNNYQDRDRTKMNKPKGKRLKKNQPQELLKPVVTHQVIRTKAVKCTKVIIPQSEDIQITSHVNSFPIRPDIGSPASSADFPVELDIEEMLSMSDNMLNLGSQVEDMLEHHGQLLNDEAHEINYYGVKDVFYSPDDFISSNQEEVQLKDPRGSWRNTDLIQSNGTCDFNALESFLNSEDEFNRTENLYPERMFHVQERII